MSDIRDMKGAPVEADRVMSAATVGAEIGRMAAHAAEDGVPIVGAVLVMVDENGGWVAKAKTFNPDHPIGMVALAGIAVSAITRFYMVEPQIQDAMVRNGIVAPPPPEGA